MGTQWGKAKLTREWEHVTKVEGPAGERVMVVCNVTSEIRLDLNKLDQQVQKMLRKGLDRSRLAFGSIEIRLTNHQEVERKRVLTSERRMKGQTDEATEHSETGK